MEKPILRFKGYNDNWENYLFKDILLVNSGKDYKNCKEGNIPVYGTGGYMLSIDKSLCSEDAIGIGRKGSIDKPQYLKAPFWTIDTLFFLTLKKEFDLAFLYYMANIIEWRKLDESTGVPSLSKENIDKICCKIPCISEQHLISRYFSLLDSKIKTVSKEIQCLYKIKSACLQSMFPQDGESVPKVRFKGFNEEWRTKQLSECLFVSHDKNTDKIYSTNDVLSVSDDYGVRNQIELLGRSYAGKSVSNYGILHKGDIVFTKSPLKSKPFGIVKMNTYMTGIVSVLYAIYKPKESISPLYIHYYFAPAWRLNKYLSPLVNKGAKNTMNISDEYALSGEIMIPSFEEQQKIAAYFKKLDQQISLQNQRLEKLKQIKSACLDKMFV